MICYAVQLLYVYFQTIGEFLLIDHNMRVKPRGKVYSVNEGYSKFWYEPLKEYIDGLKTPPVIIFIACI